MSDDKILKFPKSKIIREQTQSIEELEKLKVRGTQNFADALIQDIAESILGEFGGVGINMETNEFPKDFQFLVHVLTATVYRSLKLDHSFHDIIDNQIKFEESLNNSC